MEDRTGLILLVLLVSLVVNFFDIASVEIAKEVKGLGPALLAMPFGILIGLGMAFIAAWVDSMLWNHFAPRFGLPTIDVVDMLLLGWLIGFLIRGMTPMRVREIGRTD